MRTNLLSQQAEGGVGDQVASAPGDGVGRIAAEERVALPEALGVAGPWAYQVGC